MRKRLLALVIGLFLVGCTTQAANDQPDVPSAETDPPAPTAPAPTVPQLQEADVIGLVKSYMWQSALTQDQVLFLSRCGGLEYPFEKSEVGRLRGPASAFVDYLGEGVWKLETEAECIFIVDDRTGRVTGPGQ